MEQKEELYGRGVVVYVEEVWWLWHHHRVVDEIEDGASKWLHCWRLMAINRTDVIRCTLCWRNGLTDMADDETASDRQQFLRVLFFLHSSPLHS